MATLTIVAHDTLGEISQKLRTAHDEAFKNRLKAIRLALQGRKRYEIVDQLAVDSTRVTIWIQKYNRGGTEALQLSKGGRPKGNPKWSVSLFKSLSREIDKGGYWSIPRMQKWLKENHDLDIPEQTVWYRMDKLNYSYKSARPHPVLGDKGRQETFKKGASPRSWQKD